MLTKKEYEDMRKPPKYIRDDTPPIKLPPMKMTKRVRDIIGQFILAVALLTFAYIFLKYNTSNYMEFFWSGEVIPIVLLTIALIYCADWLSSVEIIPNNNIPKEPETLHNRKHGATTFNYVLFKWGRFIFKYRWRK